MLRLVAAAGALAIAIVALSLAQTSSPAHAFQAAKTGASSGCEGQAPQSAGDLQAKQNTQRMFNAFANFGDIKGEAESESGPSLSAGSPAPQASRAQHSKEIYVESRAWGAGSGGQFGGCPPAQRATSRRTK